MRVESPSCLFPSPSKTVASQKLSLTPPHRANRHLDGGQTPIFTVIMTLVPIFADSRPEQSLVFCEGGENTKDDGDAGIELDAHEAVRDRVGDVLEVHSFAFDQNTDGNHRVEGLGGHRCDHYRRRIGRGGGGRSGCCGARGERRAEGESTEKVCCRCPRLDS